MKKIDFSTVYDTNDGISFDDVDIDFDVDEFYEEDVADTQSNPSKKVLKTNYRTEIRNLLANEIDKLSCERGYAEFIYEGRTVRGVPMGVTGSGKIIFDVNGKLEAFKFDLMDFII